MLTPPPFPSHLDNDVLDMFFAKGRNLWPDIGEIEKLEFDRSKFDDNVINFLKSTSMNEYGTAHYTKGYYNAYGNDYKLNVWAMVWGSEEYMHYLVLRKVLLALGEEIEPHIIEGVEYGDFYERYVQYLEDIRVDPAMDPRLVQAVYGVVQEYSAVIAYTAVAEAVDDPEFTKVMKRISKDEMRHSRFNQISVEALIKQAPEQRKYVWPQFSVLFKDHKMPQEFIDMYDEEGIGTDLYTSFWTPKFRSKLVLYLTHYFGQFREEAVPAAATA